jgi:TRAP-type C4-dicarboxylate transport system substrate-binding protein
MNKQFYDKLPEDLQQVVNSVTAKIQKESYDKSANVYHLYDLKCKEAVKGRGEVYRPTPEEMALWTKDIEDFWKRVTEKNPEVYDLIMEIQKL